MDILNVLEKATQINSVSGSENEIRKFISDNVKKYCDELSVDAMGNLIAHKKGSGKKIMFAAHMDEIGIIVTDIDDKGFVRFSSVGGLNLRNLVNLRVHFANGVEGVIGAEVSKALDNRVGCAILMQALSEIKDCENDLYFVFTTQEEVGLRGAKTAAFAINPDIAVAVDVTDTGDTPSAPTMAIELGKGTAIKVMDRSIMCDADVRTMMIETAKKNKIPYQLEIMTDGGTDAGAIHLTRAGIKTGGISVPTRYVHSPSEMASVSDIENSVKLLYNIAIAQW